MSDVDDIWRRKSDYDLQQAGSLLFQYGAAARKAIRAELDRRGLGTADEWPKCLSCNARIGLREDHLKCRSCGKAFPTAFQQSLSDWANGEGAGADENVATETAEEALSEPIGLAEHPGLHMSTPPPTDRNPVVVRYRDGYRAAALVVLVGQVFKILGVAIWVLIAGIADSISSPLGGGRSLLAARDDTSGFTP